MGNGADTTTARPARRRRFISLRLLASLAAAGLVAVTVLVLVAVNEKNIRRTLIDESRTQLVLEGRNLAITSSDALLTEFPELSLIPLLVDMKQDRPELLDVVIIDHKGRIQGSPDSRATGTIWQEPQGLQPIKLSTPLAPGERLRESDLTMLVDSPIHYGHESDLGRVIIVLDKGFIEAKVKANRRSLLLIAAILLVVAVGLTAILMSNLFRPLSLVREGLERIGRGVLDAPMQVRDFTELGMLSDGVNVLAAQLATSQRLAEAREREVIETQKEVIITLGQVVEGRSTETANHTIRVGDMSYELARLAGLPEHEAELVRIASPMHDVGKIGIKDAILNKPGKLTAEEYKNMQDHPVIGFNILNKSTRPVFKAAAIIAHEHHERWDGNGYPRGMIGEETHIYGRIVGLVDVFDAIFSNRVYRRAMPLEQALGIIRDEAGHHFEPRLAELFLDNLPKFLAIAEQYEDWPVEPPVEAPVEAPVELGLEADMMSPQR
jgi:response regulator RpfG family c-di-GMP phosphodiesterase